MQKHTYGPAISKMREKANLTQKGIATALKLSSAQFISNWERGAAKIPVRMVPKLSKVLKVKPEAVIDVMVADTKATMLKKMAAPVRAKKVSKKAKPKKSTKKAKKK
jgi:transcriptional regulator with XRE-family HTH domain